VQIVYLFTESDSRSGVVAAAVVPEPGSLALAVWAGILLINAGLRGMLGATGKGSRRA
jgi:hypothetical protein